MKLKIWTYRYCPFILGGDVWQPFGTEIEPVNKPQPLGHGHEGIEIYAPDGKSYIVHAATGALIGPDIATVKEDMEGCTKEEIDEVVARHADAGKRAELVTPEEFWRVKRE